MRECDQLIGLIDSFNEFCFLKNLQSISKVIPRNKKKKKSEMNPQQGKQKNCKKKKIFFIPIQFSSGQTE